MIKQKEINTNPPYQTYRQLYTSNLSNWKIDRSKIKCYFCSAIIHSTTKILTNQYISCLFCFSKLDSYPDYFVLNRLTFNIFQKQWTAQEELLMLQAMQTFGFGNWQEIKQYMQSQKSLGQIQKHYQRVWLNSKYGRQQGCKKQIRLQNQQQQKRKQQQFLILSNSKNSSQNKQELMAQQEEIVGYMVKRKDFEIQYDYEAQQLLSNLQFFGDQTQIELQLKNKIFDLYNDKLKKRYYKKDFVISRNLLGIDISSKNDKNSKLNLPNLTKCFARFNNAEDHQKWVKGLQKQKSIRKRLLNLKRYRYYGLKNQEQIQMWEKNEKQGFIKNKKAADNNNWQLQDDTRLDVQINSLVLSQQEIQFVNSIQMSISEYIVVRQVFRYEQLQYPKMTKEEFLLLFKTQFRQKIGLVFDKIFRKPIYRKRRTTIGQ